ncbi:MAG: hypothetical protein M3Y81_05495 [Chloroflexota bacterium]|nr:hypothetical protein [Chloroflexota bacterium]
MNAQRGTRALVVNCSIRADGRPFYNLGAHKLSDWLQEQGYAVTSVHGDPGLWELDADLVCLSVIFSWHAPLARQIALRMKDRAEIWAGGPGLFALAHWWRQETGCEVTRGLDQRFDRQRGNYLMCFASRGCPVNCSFCIVPRLEGVTFSYDPDFIPAPILCDNNLSALPVAYQDHIIARYRACGIPLKDANSGFEPHFFDEGTYRRWKPVLRGVWRFALDEMRELDYVQRMLRILTDEPARRKRVYCLVGNEPIAACYERATKILEWGGEPFCQFILPLNWLGDPRKVKLRYDWTSYQQGQDFVRYFNSYGWRSYPIWEYLPRKQEAPPFVFLHSQEVSA